MKKVRSHKYKDVDPVKQFREWMKNTLRKAFFRYYGRSKTIQLARVDRGLYRCAKCLKIDKIDGYHVDHIKPVVETSVGFVDWNTYISRLFCEADNLQFLCSECHKTKTKTEQEERKLAKTGIYAKGKNHSEETKFKISDSHKGKIPSNLTSLHIIKYKRVVATNTLTNEVRQFKSLTEAADKLQVSSGNIGSVLKGRRNHTGGWIFKYENND